MRYAGRQFKLRTKRRVAHKQARYTQAIQRTKYITTNLKSPTVRNLTNSYSGNSLFSFIIQYTVTVSRVVVALNINVKYLQIEFLSTVSRQTRRLHYSAFLSGTPSLLLSCSHEFVKCCHLTCQKRCRAICRLVFVLLLPVIDALVVGCVGCFVT